MLCRKWEAENGNKLKIQRIFPEQKRAEVMKFFHDNSWPFSLYWPGEPMESITIDILGHLPLTKSGNCFIIVITDTVTKWTEAIAMPK
jgi:hypothetical protein